MQSCCSLALFLLALLAPNTISNALHDIDETASFREPVGPDEQPINCDKNQMCTESVLGPESYCLGTRCLCTKEATQSRETKKCLIERGTLGSGCEEDWQCTRVLGDAVTCTGHLCSCKPDAAVVNGKCWMQISLGGSCTDNEECIGGHDTVCRDQICQCISSKVPHPDNSQCLDEAQSTGEPCVETIQCTAVLGDGASCRDGKCQCLIRYHGKNKGCVKNLILEEKCTNVDGECYLEDSFGLDHVKCDDICQCNENFIPSKDRTQCIEEGKPGIAENVSPMCLLVSIMSIIIIYTS